MKKINFLSFLLDFFEIVLIGAGIYFAVQLFIAQRMEITGNSMSPTLEDKEQILAEKVSINFNPLKRGEIIVFRHPKDQERLVIKRVIGLPGENFEIKEGAVYINDKQLSEEYANGLIKSNSSDNAIVENVIYEIPEGAYIVLGDNRDVSYDSREWGILSKELVIGRAVLVYYPYNSIRILWDK